MLARARHALTIDDLTRLFRTTSAGYFKEDAVLSKDLDLKPGLLAMAKLRGFVLSVEKSLEPLDILENTPFAQFILENCSRNEGLQKLYSFHTMESLAARVTRVTENQTGWLVTAARLLVKNLEYPLHSVSSSCEGILRRFLVLASPAQVAKVIDIVMGLSSRHEIKAKYLALGLALPYLDANKFVANNQGVMAEMIHLSQSTPQLSKFVMSFLE